MTHQSHISATAPVATSGIRNCYQPGNAQAPVQYIGWNIVPPPMVATGRAGDCFSRESSDGAGDGPRATLGGANTKVPEERPRQRVAQACEKCRERKAAVSIARVFNSGYSGIDSYSLICQSPPKVQWSCSIQKMHRAQARLCVCAHPANAWSQQGQESTWAAQKSMAAAKAAKANTGGGAGLTISTRRPSSHSMGHVQQSDAMHLHKGVKTEDPPLTSGTRGASYFPSEPMEMGNHGSCYKRHEFCSEATNAGISPLLMATPAGFLFTLLYDCLLISEFTLLVFRDAFLRVLTNATTIVHAFYGDPGRRPSRHCRSVRR